MTRATSSGCPQRSAGSRSRIFLARSGLFLAPLAMRVSIQPGATALTRMPSAAQATASDLVICTTPPLLAA